MAATTEDEKLQTTEETSQKPIKSCESDKSKPVTASNTTSDTKKHDSSNVDTSAIASKTSSAKSDPSNDASIDKSLSESCTKEDQKRNTATTSTPIVSKISKQTVESVPHPQVEQQLAEMMDIDATDVLDDKDNESSKDTEQQSNASNTSLGDLNDLNDDTLADEMDVSDVSSSIAENENESKTQSPRKKPKKRQPPIMIGYKKRRKVHNKKMDDDSKPESEIGSPISEPVDEKSADDSKKLDMSGSSDDNASETSSTKSTSRSVSMVDKYCWICHRDGASSHKCIACPRVYHRKCLFEPVEDPNNFHCPECSAILKADNVNTRSPVMQAVNLDQLCTLLKHVIDIIKIQRDAHYFLGPVDTREFPHYREYVVYPMDILTLEKNIKNKVYGCTEAFLADMKWIVHNSVVFNTKAAKITNVAKNLLKTCRREVLEIETCAECYYNLLVRKDTWFIEVCKRPHLLIWARLKGYPPWPAKALKCKDEMVDCRFFGAHDKAWVPLKDCYLYSKVPPGIIKIKPGSNLDEGLQEIDKHIKKLKDKFGKFVYAEYRVPYNPAEEMKQLQTMLPNFDPTKVASVTKPSVQIDQSKTIKPKCLFDDSTTSTSTPAAAPAPVPAPTPPPSNKSSPSETKSVLAKPETSSEEPSKPSTDVNESTSAAAKVADDESSASNSSDGHASTGDEAESTIEEESTAKTAESSQTDVKISTPSSDTEKTQDATDTEAEESDSSRSTTKSTTSNSENSQNAESAKKKVVSVKKIETINAAVAPEKSVRTPVPIAPKPMPGLVPTIPVSVASIANSNIVTSSGQLTRRITDAKMEMIRNVKAIDEKNKPKSVITVKNFASFEKCDSLVGKSPPTQAPPLAPISSRRESAKVTRRASSEHNFNLDNVKEEPVEVESSPSSEDPIFVKEVPPPQPPPPAKVIPNKPIQPKSTVDMAHRKRSLAEDTDSTSTDGGKKSKNDSGVGCRTVNITENVTLSLINNQMASVVENVPAAVPTKTQPPVIKIKQPPKTHVVATNVSSSDTQTQMPPFAHASIIAKPVRIAPAPGPMATPIRMFTTTAQQQRIVNGNTTINGTTVPSRSNILLVQSPKQPVKPTFGQNGTGEIIVQFMSELLNNNRKAMEDTLDKIAGKGDLRAKVILLQKEIENMKKSHDIMIEEIKRDYEVQIAELRAASLAQKKYDLAHERLKFEKEKELAVKEAKSKQWCSNCQKSANYYCCWNTAYCDFECQKEHWNQHMPVCKNDVKRKAAECSENEPPRIMMQNEVLNDYQSMMNGYDKINPNTYAYQNSNSIALSSRSNGGVKIQPKSAANKSNQRPLLPRVTATVTCSPSVFSSSTPMVTATLVDNSYHQNVSSSVAPIRSTMLASVNMHPLIRQVQQQFHK